MNAEPVNPYREPGELQSLAGEYPRGFTLSPERVEQYLELVALAQDLIHPDQYGHGVPAEVRRRAARVLRLAPAPRSHDGPGGVIMQW